MIADNEAELMQFCASCGTAGGGDIKLKRCTACYLVRYCGVKCQKDHRPKHKKECKKRAAELRDELLFKQPESNHLGDCPICCVPLTLLESRSVFMSCCSKRVCNGCDYASQMRETLGRLEQKCPFCRTDVPSTDEEYIRRLMVRVEANDPAAICFMGTTKALEGDYETAFEYWTKAVALGDVEAHYRLSGLYQYGRGVEKNEKKQIHHLTQATIAGHPLARHNLGCVEGDNGQRNRGLKHVIIAAKQGNDSSLEMLKDLHKAGHVSKEDFAAALRGHKAATEATKSTQREEAAEYEKWEVECKRKGI